MRAGALVVVDVRGQDAAQMALVEDHDVIQTFAANRTDHPLDVGVLPRGAWLWSAKLFRMRLAARVVKAFASR